MVLKVRFFAFLVHLAGSASLAVAALALVFLVWYPAPLHLAVGVTDIFLLMLGVDVVLGPVLTFVVFKPGKKTLKFDLGAIVAVQLLAFAYGMLTVAEGRPAWLVFNVDRFDLVRVNELDDRHPERASAEYRHAPWFGPGWVSARLPADAQARSNLTVDAVFAGLDLPQRPDLYLPLAAEADTLRQKMHPLDELLRYNPPAEVEAVRRRWPTADAWLPMMSNVQPVAVLLRKESAEVVAVVDLKPWN